MTVATRRTTPEDATALARLDARAFDAPWDASSFRDLLANELTLGWRRDTGDVLVGALLIRRVAGEADILRLATDPSARRQGHARALLRTLLEEVGADLPYGVRLEVRAANHAAVALYASEGFQEIGRRAAYYVAPADAAVLMGWWPEALGGHL